MAMTNAERQKAYRERKKKQERNENALRLKKFANQIISRPALLYHGGKWRIASWIIEHFPKHECYVEPYGGAMNVLLRKSPAAHEVYNDLNEDVVNFFHVLREYPEDLIRKINLTPYSRQEWSQAWDITDDVIERARKFYVRCWQSYGSGTSDSPSRTGWRNQKTDRSGASALKSFHDTDRLWDIAARLLAVQIEKQDAIKVINRYDAPTTLFYVDPPYVFDTRSEWAGKAYSNEMADDAHIELIKTLIDAEGMTVLSGYDSELYRDMLPDWTIVSKETRDINSNEQTELLWLSPGIYESVKLPLFANL